MALPVIFKDLSLIDYKQAWDYQEELFQQVIAQKLQNRDLAETGRGELQFAPTEQGQPLQYESTSGTQQQTTNHTPQTSPNHEPQTTNNYLLFCEHPPVITLGKTGKENNLLMSEKWLKQQGIDFYHINRGGDITYHGPGQVVGYPILDLGNFFTDIDKYLRLLEEMIIRTLAEYGIKGERLAKATGVWLDAGVPGRERKICAMGIKCSRWVTMHGFALNVNTNLNHFNYIVPCGLSGKQVTSMEKELGTKIDVKNVKEKLKRHFEQLFGVELVINKDEAVVLK